MIGQSQRMSQPNSMRGLGSRAFSLPVGTDEGRRETLSPAALRNQAAHIQAQELSQRSKCAIVLLPSLGLSRTSWLLFDHLTGDQVSFPCIPLAEKQATREGGGKAPLQSGLGTRAHPGVPTCFNFSATLCI